jgi:hypothetical protein
MHEDEEVQAVTSSLQQQESHSVSSLSSTGAMKARARQSWILSAGTPIKPGMVSVHDVKGGEPIHANFASENSTQGQTTTKIEDGDAQESSSMQNYRVVGRSPTDDQPGLNAKAVHNQASVPSLPGAVASTEEEQLKAKEGSVQWTDPLDEVSNINPSFQASARSMDTYSQFAKNPDFVHLLDSSLPSRENPEQSRLGWPGDDVTINAPVRHLPVWQSDSDAMAFRTKVHINWNLCLIGAGVLVAIMLQELELWLAEPVATQTIATPLRLQSWSQHQLHLYWFRWNALTATVNLKDFSNRRKFWEILLQVPRVVRQCAGRQVLAPGRLESVTGGWNSLGAWQSVILGNPPSIGYQVRR